MTAPASCRATRSGWKRNSGTSSRRYEMVRNKASMKLQRKYRIAVLTIVLNFLFFGTAASEPAAPEAESAPQADSTDALQKVLSQMDATASSFRTAQSNFVWEQFQKVINETETQKGTVYYRRSGKEIQMMADI